MASEVNPLEIAKVQDENNLNNVKLKDYEVGTRLNSGVIVSIYSKGDQFVIYQCEGDWSYSYHYDGMFNQETVAAVHLVDMIVQKAAKKLKKTPDNELLIMSNSLYQKLLSSDDPKAHQTEINNLDNYVNSLKEVKALLGYSRNYKVWITDDDEVTFLLRNNIANTEHSIAEFVRLKNLGVALLPKALIGNFNWRLGAALVTAFEMKQDANAKEIFSPLEIYIQTVINNKLRIKFLITATLVSSILTALAYLIYVENFFDSQMNSMLIVIGGGFIGTYISVFERSKTISIIDNESTTLLITQVIIRLVLGGVFGLISYTAAITGLAFSIFIDSNSSIFLLGVAAGFSERLIPDLIESFTTDNKNN